MKDSLLRLVNAKTSLARFVEIFADTIRYPFREKTEHEREINRYLFDNYLDVHEEADSVDFSDTFLSELPNHPKLKLVSENFYKNIHNLSLIDVETGEVVNDIANTSESFLSTLRMGSYLNYIRNILGLS